jgi:hypothetical protein
MQSPGSTTDDEEDFSPLPSLRRQLLESRTALSRADARIVASTRAAAVAQEAVGSLELKLRESETQVGLLRREVRMIESPAPANPQRRLLADSEVEMARTLAGFREKVAELEDEIAQRYGHHTSRPHTLRLPY